jgi:membrane-associated protease RseP (regulator of RpoE activity)
MRKGPGCILALALCAALPALASDVDDPRPFAHGGRGRLGVQVQELTPELREFLGAPRDHGVLVSRVEEDSPADAAGLRVGDVIVRVGEREIDDARDLVQEVAGVPEGEEIDVRVSRNGADKTLSVKPRGARGEPGFGSMWKGMPHPMPHMQMPMHEEMERRLEDIEKRLEELERRMPGGGVEPQRKT